MKNENSLYKSPASVLVNVEESLEIIPAGKWLRFSNLLIDYIAFIFLGIVVGVAVAILFGEKGVVYIESMPDLVLGTPIILSYYLVCEGLTGRTLGKVVTGTKVVNESGGKASFFQIIGRTFSRLIPFEAFSFLVAEGRGWHDRLPKTYVIKCR